MIGAGGFELPNWLQGYQHFWEERAREAAGQDDPTAATIAHHNAENAKAFAAHMRDLTQQYQISYIELDQDLGLEKVCDIFTQLNSKGVRLDVFDLMNALLKPKGLQLKHMWRDASRRLEFVETTKMNVYVLQVMSILKQIYCSPRYLYYLLPKEKKVIRHADGSFEDQILIESIDEFEASWNNAVDALENAIEMLRHPQEFGVVSSKYLPYVSILPVFSAMQLYLKTAPPALRFSGQRKIRHWYWASVFTNRYSGPVESTSARDFLDVRNWIEKNEPEPALIEEFKNRFRSLELRRETNSGSSVYNGVFNLLVMNGARDWYSGTIPPHGDLDDHHIVPVAWAGSNLSGSVIHSILNRTPLTAETNRNVIGKDLPNIYLRKLIDANGEAAVRSTLETHLISPAAFDILLRDPFTAADFDVFLAERHRSIREAIENLLIKERLDLPPDLRKLDAEIETVELELRSCIATTLNGNVEALPQHVQQKVIERVKAAERRNPALDGQATESLAGLLEYCDLRELQDIMTAKATWPQFEPRFVVKEPLNAKFGQLAELRNRIRHSRTVDQVTRLEGNAALHWFNEILDKRMVNAVPPV